MLLHACTTPQMQVRFDGMLGFPGGMVDKGETPAQAVIREFNEEVGCPEGLVTMTTEDHVCTHYSHHTRLCLHFFAKEVSPELYLNIERCPQSASHWGIEVGVSFMCTHTHTMHTYAHACTHTHTHTHTARTHARTHTHTHTHMHTGVWSGTCPSLHPLQWPRSAWVS